VSWCAHGPIHYVKSPVDGRTTPQVHDAAVGTRLWCNAARYYGVAHWFHLLGSKISAASISYAEWGVKVFDENNAVFRSFPA
jgi:hypothetical protein